MSNGNSKGMSPLGWAAIGCGGCLVLVLAAMTACGGMTWWKFGDIIQEAADNPTKAAAMAIVRANPDLELVSSDDDAGTMTIRDKDGKTFTVDWEEIKQGRLRIETDEGEMSIDASGEEGTVTFSGADGEAQATFGAGADADDAPSWVPRDPDADKVAGAFSSSDASGSRGAFSYRTGATLAEVTDWYAETLTGKGFEETSRFSQGEMISVSLAQDQRTLTVLAVREAGEDETQVTIQYGEEK